MRLKNLAFGVTSVVLGIAFSTISCGDDDGDTASNNVNLPANNNEAVNNNTANNNMVDARIQSCRDTIAAKTTQFATELTTWSIADATEMVQTDVESVQNSDADYAGFYRDDLDNHPGCAKRAAYLANTSEPFSFDNEATVATGTTADITGYPCAAKAYDQPNEDTDKPIVILVHGNSSGTSSFEAYFNATLAGTTITNLAGFEVVVDTAVREQLAAKLVNAGYRVIGFDARVDRVATLADFSADQNTGNPFFNIDHGWAVPMLQSLIQAVMQNNPNRQVSIIGHSLGVTVTRDALRRLYNQFRASASGSVNPYAQLKDVILLSGANHGVSSGALLCPGGTAVLNNMRSTVTCEMGDRAAFTPTYFTQPLNGPGDLFSTPCADGDYAYGETDQCSGNVVEWTTVTMEDIPNGELQDEFVSEASSALANGDCVDNQLITLSDFDTTGYFFTGAPGFLANHFGSARSEAGMTLILDRLAD